MSIERDKLEEIGDYLRGSCKSLSEAITAFNLDEGTDESQLEADLLDVEIELCVNCHWWHEVHELQYSEENSGGVCEQCCDELGIEFD